MALVALIPLAVAGLGSLLLDVEVAVSCWARPR
jgi:hypothetical protein